jgi:glycosyltransferase involved in cell wall biosynthesis
VRNRRVIEVVSGLGMGGAERALGSRLRYQPKDFESVIFNHKTKIDQIPLPTNPPVFVSKENFFSICWNFLKVTNTFNPDIVIVRTPLDLIRFSIITFLFARNRWRLVFEAHSNFVTTKKFVGVALTPLIQLAQIVVTLTIAVSENVRLGPLCNSRATVVYLGSDISTNTADFPKSDKPGFLFLGRLVEVKDPMLLLSAIFELSREESLPERFLTIVGDGPLMNKLRSFVSENGLENIVEFTGFRVDVTDFLIDATHLISVSKNEGLPISFFEAKLTGVRIISTPSGGGNEIFDEFDHELPSFEVSDLVSHLKTILNEEISSESRGLIASNSLWMKAENCSKKYYDLLRSLADR